MAEQEKLFDLSLYRTDEKKENEGVMCYISGLGEDGPGFRVRHVPNPDYLELQRELSIKHHEEINSDDVEVRRARHLKNRVELMCRTVITEAHRFMKPGTSEAWVFTPESGIEFFSQSGFNQLLDMLGDFATTSSNYRYEPPTEAQAAKAADVVKSRSSSGKRTRRKTSKA